VVVVDVDRKVLVGVQQIECLVSRLLHSAWKDSKSVAIYCATFAGIQAPYSSSEESGRVSEILE